MVTKEENSSPFFRFISSTKGWCVPSFNALELHGEKAVRLKRLLVESLVFQEDKFDASSFRIIL